MAVKGIDRPKVIHVMQVRDVASVGNPQQKLRETRGHTDRGSRITDKTAAEAQSATRGGRLENRELLKTNLGAKFEGMLAAR